MFSSYRTFRAQVQHNTILYDAKEGHCNELVVCVSIKVSTGLLNPRKVKSHKEVT